MAQSLSSHTCQVKAAKAYLHRYFSSSVIWMTIGTLKTFCSQTLNMKGMRWPRWSASDDGPCKVGISNLLMDCTS